MYCTYNIKAILTPFRNIKFNSQSQLNHQFYGYCLRNTTNYNCMPRIPHSLLRRARAISKLLPLLLPTCRDIPSARNELRWLGEHATERTVSSSGASWRALLRKLCVQRGRGKPLQYILGNQPFGDLEILCRKGVLIPRLVSLFTNVFEFKFQIP